MYMSTVQNRTCLIDGKCYNANDFNPADETQKCDPDKSSTGWTASESDFPILGEMCHCVH